MDTLKRLKNNVIARLRIRRGYINTTYIGVKKNRQIDYKKLTGSCQRHTLRKHTVDVSNSNHNSTSFSTAVQPVIRVTRRQKFSIEHLDESYVSLTERISNDLKYTSD